MRTRYLALLATLLAALGLSARLAPAVLAISYPAGWNLVSGPTGSTLQGATGSLYTLQPGDSDYEVLPSSSSLRTGWGYWAFFPNGGSLLTAPGVDSYSVSLSGGATVLLGDPSAINPSTVTGAVAVLGYTPGGDYSKVMTIPAGQGAWVSGSGNVTLWVQESAPTQATTAAAVAPAPLPQSGSVSASPAISLQQPTQSGVVNVASGPTSPVGRITRITANLSIAGSVFADADLSDSQTTSWLTVSTPTKVSYIRQVVAALHAAYPSVASVYFTVWGDWTTSFLPQSVPIQYVTVVGTQFWSYWPDVTGRWTSDGYSYQPDYDADADVWLPM